MPTTPETPRVVVITGASSGFGRGAAVAFAKRGDHVFVAARREQVLDEIVAECQSHGGQATAAPTDVSDPAAVEALATTVLAAAGRIDVWVNDAGVAALGRFDEVPLADHLQVIATDLLGTVAGSYVALRQFREQQHGVLINIASVLGKISAPYYASYSAAKAGIVGLNGALRQELAEQDETGIHVCTVLPMAMDTPFFEHAGNYTGHEAVPIPPVYDPDEVVAAIVKLADEPEDEVIVGGAGKVMTAVHAVARGVTEKLLGAETHEVQLEKAPPAAPTPGNVHTPVAAGTGVHADQPG